MKTITNKTRLFLTGMTSDEVRSAQHTSEYLESIGQDVDTRMDCYLCKRKQGDEVIALNLNNDNEEMISELEIVLWETTFDGDEYQYAICKECLFLLRSDFQRIVTEDATHSDLEV